MLQLWLPLYAANQDDYNDAVSCGHVEYINIYGIYP